MDAPVLLTKWCCNYTLNYLMAFDRLWCLQQSGCGVSSGAVLFRELTGRKATCFTQRPLFPLLPICGWVNSHTHRVDCMLQKNASSKNRGENQWRGGKDRDGQVRFANLRYRHHTGLHNSWYSEITSEHNHMVAPALCMVQKLEPCGRRSW